MQSDGPERPKGARGAAFVRLFRAAYPRIIAKLRRYGVEAPDAEDIAQHAFELYVERRIEHRKPRAWLLETARRLAANWRRLARHRFEKLTPPSDIDSRVFDAAPTVDLIAELGQWCDLAEQLPKSARDTLRLHLQGHSYEEAGAILGITRSAAWARMQNIETSTIAGMEATAMQKRAHRESNVHYYRDGRIMVEVPIHVGDATYQYVFLSERPELKLVGVYQDRPHADESEGTSARVKLTPAKVPRHEANRSNARQIAGRAIAHGPMQKLIRAVTRCFYGGGAFWQCLNDCHEMREVEVKGDRSTDEEPLDIEDHDVPGEP